VPACETKCMSRSCNRQCLLSCHCLMSTCKVAHNIYETFYVNCTEHASKQRRPKAHYFSVTKQLLCNIVGLIYLFGFLRLADLSSSWVFAFAIALQSYTILVYQDGQSSKTLVHVPTKHNHRADCNTPVQGHACRRCVLSETV